MLSRLVPPQLLLAWPTSTDYETDDLVGAIYAQREPWRTRFLQLAAKAVSGNGNGRVPERVEVEGWLRQSQVFAPAVGGTVVGVERNA